MTRSPDGRAPLAFRQLGDGNLRERWTKGVGDELDKGADCVKNQYDAYTVASDVHLKSCEVW